VYDKICEKLELKFPSSRISIKIHLNMRFKKKAKLPVAPQTQEENCSSKGLQQPPPL